MGLQPIDFTDVDELVDELRVLGPVRLAVDRVAPFTVDLDAQRVSPPGCYVQLREIGAGALGAQTYRLRLHLVASDVDPRDVMRELEAIANHVAPLVNGLGGPAGPLELATLVLPDSTKLPALIVPIDLDTNPGD